MARLSLLFASLSLLVLFHGSLARQLLQSRGECQLDRLNALEPDSRVQSEAGETESWNPNHQQFQCAGVAVVRRTIQPNGLLLPFYSNSPQLIYIIQGRGMTGVLFPGCPETFQESQLGSRQGRAGSRGVQDQHQRIQHFRAGDVIALPAGVAHWSYNNGNEPVVAVTLLDTSNSDNQLDNNPRNFFIAGNGQEEFPQQQEREYRQGERSSRRYREARQQQGSSNNVFAGLDTRLIAEAFNVDENVARRLQGENDVRGNIVQVREGELQVVRPPRLEEERQQQESGRGRRNGLEETICSQRLKENLGDPSRADVYTPEAGRLSTVNSHNLPILQWLQLSAERGVLENDALMLPHWNQNAHSIVYAIRGRARIQVVDNNGQTVFNDELNEGQVLTVPQNFAVVKRSESERFEWIAFKTNDNAMTNSLAGRNSALRALPVEVIANAYQISVEEARRIKFNRPETHLASSRSSPSTRWSIV